MTVSWIYKTLSNMEDEEYINKMYYRNNADWQSLSDVTRNFNTTVKWCKINMNICTIVLWLKKKKRETALGI